MARTSVPREVVGAFIDAAVENQVEAEEMLRHHPELRDARWLHDESVLHFVAVEDFFDAVKWLVKMGFDLNTVNEFGVTALTDVVSISNLEMAKLLISLGADVNAVSPTRGNALHRAISNGSAVLVKALLDSGAVIDYRTPDGETFEDALQACPAASRSQIEAILRPSKD